MKMISVFLWCHVRNLNPERITLSDKEFQSKLDYSGITFPVTLKQISQIEWQNQININVIGYENQSIQLDYQKKNIKIT